MNLLPQVIARVNLNGSLDDSTEAWNPLALAGLRIQSVRVDVGVYDLIAPAGVVLLPGHVTAHTTPGVTGVVESITDDRTARVHLTDSTNGGADIDCAFVVSLW